MKSVQDPKVTSRFSSQAVNQQYTLRMGLSNQDPYALRASLGLRDHQIVVILDVLHRRLEELHPGEDTEANGRHGEMNLAQSETVRTATLA